MTLDKLDLPARKSTAANLTMPSFTIDFPPLFSCGNFFNFAFPAFKPFDFQFFTKSSAPQTSFTPEFSALKFDSSRYMNFDIDFAQAYTPMPALPKLTLPKFELPSISKTNPVKTAKTNRTATSSVIKPKTTTTLAEIAKIYNPQKGAKLAQSTLKGLGNAQKGYCARAVKKGMVNAGLMGQYEYGHANETPRILSHNKNFKEVAVAGRDLNKLPAGCVICYPPGDCGYNSEVGHNTTTDGNGHGIHFQVDNIKKSDNVRVFVPV